MYYNCHIKAKKSSPKSCSNLQAATISWGFNPPSYLKVTYFYWRKEVVLLHSKSIICNFTWKEYYFPLRLLHLELKLFDYRGSETSTIIHLKFKMYNLKYIIRNITLKVFYNWLDWTFSSLMFKGCFPYFLADNNILNSIHYHYM